MFAFDTETQSYFRSYIAHATLADCNYHHRYNLLFGCSCCHFVYQFELVDSTVTEYQMSTYMGTYSVVIVAQTLAEFVPTDACHMHYFLGRYYIH